MRILFLAGREVSYARNEVLLRAFQRLGRVDIIAPTEQPASLPATSLRIAAAATSRLLTHTYDLVFIGFYGHLILRLLSNLIRRPLLFDAFVSNYDTLCFDRQRFTPHSWPGKAAFWLDRSTCRRADHILLDTEQHVDYFVRTFDLPATKFTALPVGCSEAIYHPQLRAKPQPDLAKTLVLSYTTFLPLHGMETVVQAAAKIKDAPIHIHSIGSGPLLPAIQQLAASLALSNLTFAQPVPPSVLATEIASAAICLGGHFGPSAKAGRVVPGKIYQMLAMAKPVIAGDTPANRSLLGHGQQALLVPPADPQALADAIVALHQDPALRTRLADQGYQRYQATCSEAVLTQRLHVVVQQLLDRAKPN
jgi:glycosyltransferase involved in cell wall biosynthesis